MLATGVATFGRLARPAARSVSGRERPKRSAAEIAAGTVGFGPLAQPAEVFDEMETNVADAM